jgi:hypothetical protein
MSSGSDDVAQGVYHTVWKTSRARAVQRCGELLKQIDARPQNAAKQSGATPTLISRREAAEQAGLSKDQQVTAVRVASVPKENSRRREGRAGQPLIGGFPDTLDKVGELWLRIAILE